VYEALENYNWEADIEFQSGLVAILGNNASPEQAAELTLRARCFFYSRKFNVLIDFDTYKAYRNSLPNPAPIAPPNYNNISEPPTPSIGTLASDAALSPPPHSADTVLSPPPAPSSNTLSQPAYPSSFAHIVELISTGQPIPGIKEIPDTVLTGQGTQSTKPKRRKPWEKDEVTASSGE
ncbi:hypothetical protein GQ43DRAFT_348050, partial [Delitschia confertaspora ATCC 74209]